MNRGPILGIVLCLIISVPVSAVEPLKAVAAETITIPREVWLDGSVEAVNQSTVSAQTSGEIKELHFDIDDYVEKGRLIVRLKDTEQRARLAQASSSLEEAKVRLNEIGDKHKRVKELYDRKVVTQDEMDSVNAELKAAEARRASADAGLKRAMEQLEYTQVRAPYSGIVTRRQVQLGEVAQPGQALMTGISLDKLRVLVDVPQSLVNAVRKQGVAKVKLPTGRKVNAIKITVFPFADHTSNTFKVRVDLPKNVPGLFPGMFVKVAFTVGEKEELVIPQKAIAYRGEVTGVYVISAGKISFRHIRPGKRLEEGKSTVLAGLDEGEIVALDPIRAGVLLKDLKGFAEVRDGE